MVGVLEYDGGVIKCLCHSKNSIVGSNGGVLLWECEMERGPGKLKSAGGELMQVCTPRDGP